MLFDPIISAESYWEKEKRLIDRGTSNAIWLEAGKEYPLFVCSGGASHKSTNSSLVPRLQYTPIALSQVPDSLY